MTRGARGVAPTLLERDSELDGVDEALRAAAAGAGSLVLVQGPGGIGKTALLSEIRRRADVQGLSVLRARAQELEREFGFGVVRQLLEPVLARASPEQREQLLDGAAALAARPLGLLAAPGEEPSSDTGEPFAVLHGLYWLTANIAARHPLAIVIDDAHWADGASLRFLAFLAPRLDELPVLLILAAREDEPGAALELNRLTEDPVCRRVRPSPLSAAAIARLAEEQFGTPPSEPFTAACLQATGGNPFLVRELLATLQADGIGSGAHIAGLGARTVGRSMLVRLGRLPEPAAQVARAVAVLERADLALTAAVAGVGHDEAARAADALAAAGILEPGRPLAFTHPLVRASVYGEIPSADRDAAHRRAGELLAADLGRAAEHLLATEPRGDQAVVDRLVLQARAEAVNGSPDSAVAYFRRALAEPPDPRGLPGVVLELAIAEDRSGAPEATTRLREAFRLAPVGEQRVGAAMLLAHVLAREGHSEEAVTVIDAAAHIAGPDAAAALELAAVTVGIVDARTAAGLDRRARAVRAQASGDPAAAHDLLAMAGLIAVQRNEPATIAADLARRALAGAPTALPNPTDLPWFVSAMCTLVFCECYEEVGEALDPAVRAWQAAADGPLLSAALTARSWMQLRRGELARAEADARMVLDVAGLAVPVMYRLFTTSVLVDALVERGELEAADDAVGAVGDALAGASLPAAAARAARGRLRAAQRRPEEAVADLTEAGRLLEAMLVPTPAFVPWRADAARALVMLGQQDAAHRVVREEVGLARQFGAPRALGAALRAAGTTAGGREGEVLLREAVSTLEHADAPVEHAAALTDLGAVLRRANRRTEARSLLREALHLAHTAGAHPLATRADTELRATGARPRRAVLSGTGSLTASERRVAEMAATGMSNRDIAQSLFVTARTVEGHLTQVFRKLEIGARDQLPEALT